MKIFIGCSSSNNIYSEYFDDCKALVDNLLSDNDLVFGACNSGLMGLAYDSALRNNRSVTGICPKLYTDDFDDLECSTEIVTDSVSERTQKLISESDALVFLPGGLGTLHELFTAIESKRCHDFDKPIVVYNSNGFYDGIITFIKKLEILNFLRDDEELNFFVTDSSDEVVNYISSYNKGLSRKLKNSFGRGF